MKQIESNGKKWLFVQISRNVSLCWIERAGVCLGYRNPQGDFTEYCGYIALPKDYTYIFHATTDNITEEQAAEVVESMVDENDFIIYMDYMHKSYDDSTTAIDSLQTLMRAHGIEGNHVILEMK